MTDKQLLQQLKALKSITLSQENKKNNRDVLFSQISNTSIKSDEIIERGLFNFKNIFSLVSQPLLVVAGIFVFMAGSLVLGSGFYRNSKPNDSLYIARIISERAKLNTTFSQSQRDALSLKFASDHARDIATILMDPEFNNEDNKDKIEKLNTSFKNEISKVRDRIEKNDSLIDGQKNSEGDIVFSANSLKDDNGLDIHIDNSKISSSTNLGDNSFSSDKVEDLEAIISIESLEEKIDDSSEKLAGLKDGQKIITEIEKLFSEGKYSEVVLKLNEVENMIK